MEKLLLIFTLHMKKKKIAKTRLDWKRGGKSRGRRASSPAVVCKQRCYFEMCIKIRRKRPEADRWRHFRYRTYDEKIVFIFIFHLQKTDYENSN